MLKGNFYLAVSQAFFIVTNMAMHIYLGRRLGPEAYGIFGIISTLLVVNELIWLKGVYDTISKLVSEKESAAKSIIDYTAKALALSSLFIGAFYYFFAGAVAWLLRDSGLADYIRIVAFIFPIIGVATAFLGVLNGLRRFGVQALISILSNIVRLSLVFVLVLAGFSVKGALIGLVAADLFKLAMAWTFCRHLVSGGGFDRRRLWSFTGQLMFISVLTSLVMNIDLLAVKIILKDNLQTGLYTAVLTIAKVPLILAFPILITVLPVVSKSLADGNPAATERCIRQALRLVLIFVLPISLLLTATSKNLLALFYGSGYIEASSALKILILAGAVFSLRLIISNIILAGGDPGYITFVGGLSLMIGVVLLTFLTGKFGLEGAALASALTHFIGLVLMFRYIAKRYIIRRMSSSFARIALASLSASVPAFLFQPRGIALLFWYTGLMAVFFSLLVVMGEIDLKEIKDKLTASRRKASELEG